MRSEMMNWYAIYLINTGEKYRKNYQDVRKNQSECDFRDLTNSSQFIFDRGCNGLHHGIIYV